METLKRHQRGITPRGIPRLRIRVVDIATRCVTLPMADEKCGLMIQRVVKSIHNYLGNAIYLLAEIDD